MSEPAKRFSSGNGRHSQNRPSSSDAEQAVGADRGRQRPSDPLEAAAEELQRLPEQIGDWIGRHPGISLGVALGVGVFVGWLIKRR